MTGMVVSEELGVRSEELNLVGCVIFMIWRILSFLWRMRGSFAALQRLGVCFDTVQPSDNLSGIVNPASIMFPKFLSVKYTAWKGNRCG